jgi:hypothetical protein
MNFSLGEQEWREAEEFMYHHDASCTNDCGAIGGKYTWDFTPTSIGTGVGITCNICKINQNLTDYSLW